MKHTEQSRIYGRSWFHKMMPGVAMDDCRCRLNFYSSALYGFAAMSKQHLFNIQNDSRDPLPSTVYVAKVLQNDFPIEQQIISHLFYISSHENRMSKCDTYLSEKLDKR